MQNLRDIGVIVALAGLFTFPITAKAQGIPGGPAHDAQQDGGAVESLGGAIGGVTQVLGADQRTRFREYAMREHRPTPYSLPEPVTVGTLLPPAGITLYEVPREFGVSPEYRYAVVNTSVLLVDPVTHQIVEVID